MGHSTLQLIAFLKLYHYNNNYNFIYRLRYGEVTEIF